MRDPHRNFVLVLITLLTAGNLSGATAPTEYQVKAAFLYYFAKFVEWPSHVYPAESSPIQICILGEDPFDIELDQTVRGKRAHGRALSVKRSQEISELKDCQILFIGSTENDRLPYILDSLNGLSVLTVGETKQFFDEGGIINFVILQNRVQFEINLESANQANLKISSKLLNVARDIKE